MIVHSSFNSRILSVSAVATFVVILSFQNCSEQGFATNSLSTSAAVAPPLPQVPTASPPPSASDSPIAQPISRTLAQVESERKAAWTPKNPYWEVVYDGTDTPADHVSGAFMWDNPIDDDWFDPLFSGASSYLDQFRLNTPAKGFLTVDRTFGKNYKTGSIYRRDEWLDSNFVHALFGITLEFRVKILPNSQQDAFFVNYVANECTSSFALSGNTSFSSVGSISSGDITGRNNTGRRAVDTTSDFVTYRMIRAPLATTYQVYIVNYANNSASDLDLKPISFTKLIDGQCLDSLKVGFGPGAKFPYLQIGDNSNDSDLNAAYILDFVRYRRDAISPDSSLQSLRERRPPALPPKATMNESILYDTGHLGSVSGGYFAAVPVNTPAVLNLLGEAVLLGGAHGSIQKSGKYAQLNTGSNLHADVEISHPRGLTDEGSFTIEARLKFFPEAGQRGFRISHLDTLGSVSVYFSPDKVETALGTKPAGFQSYKMSTTDDFHTYRLVRKAGELYAHLYVDDDPVPKIVDQHLSAETESRGYAYNPVLSFGAYKIYPEPFVFPVKTTSTNVLIDFIRWHGSAFAPAN